VSATRCRRASAPIIAAVACLLAGCGGDAPASSNPPRPPIELVVTGVVSADELRLSPRQIGGGPTNLLVANLTDVDLSIALEGENVIARSARIVAGATGEIRRTLDPGEYVVTAESATTPIATTTLRVGPERPSSDRSLLLP
jgi:hypothetical protein